MDYRSVFERLDDDFSGMISTKTFHAALNDLESDLTNLEVEGLESRFGIDSKSAPFLSHPNHTIERENELDKDLNLTRYHQQQWKTEFAPQHIKYVEMLHWAATAFLSSPNEESEANVNWINNNSMQQHSDWQVEERFRQMIRQKFDFWLRGKLRKAFKHFDTTRIGVIAENQFSIGLQVSSLCL